MKRIVVFIIGVMIGAFFAREIRPIMNVVFRTCSEVVSEFRSGISSLR